MNKEQFLNALGNRLRSNLPENERQRILEYYSEMIDDCMEHGVSETDAVTALGGVEGIVSDILGTAEPKPEEEIQTALVPVPGENSELHSIFIKDPSAQIDIRPCEESDGSCTIDFFPPECKEDYSITRENGVLNIRRIKSMRNHPGTVKRFGFFGISFGQDCRLAVNLPASELRNLTIEGISGDVDINAVKTCSEISVHTVSGSIKVDETECSRLAMQAVSGDLSSNLVKCSGKLSAIVTSADLELHDVECGEAECDSTSGDLTLTNVICSGAASINSRSGDLEISHSKFGGNVSCSTGSGDVTVWDTECSASVFAKSGSGDVNLSDLNASGGIGLESASGDVECTSASATDLYCASSSGDVALTNLVIEGKFEAGDISGDLELNAVCVKTGPVEISTTSGDISGCLIGGSEQYSFRTRTRSGDVDVPHGNGPVLVNVRSVSGDIALSTR